MSEIKRLSKVAGCPVYRTSEPSEVPAWSERDEQRQWSIHLTRGVADLLALTFRWNRRAFVNQAARRAYARALFIFGHEIGHTQQARYSEVDANTRAHRSFLKLARKMGASPLQARRLRRALPWVI